jgi:transcriptional regulator
MYIPSSFSESNISKLHDLIRSNSFGLLVSSGTDQPLATHLPVLLDSESGRYGTLLGHVAKANPHWNEMEGQRVLAIFSGPHAYISPRWYESEDVVPTWNYVAVHAYGTVSVLHDKEELREILLRSVELFESNAQSPWVMPDSNYMDRMMQAIVGLRIEIDQIEGKWKLSQNQPMDRRMRVVESLEKQGDFNSMSIADIMRSQWEKT